MSRSTALLWWAGLLGLLNAAPSYYWAFGGGVLLETIGTWLIDLRDELPVLTGLALLGIAVSKTLAVLIPLAAAHLLRFRVRPSRDLRTVAAGSRGSPYAASRRLASSRLSRRPDLWWNVSRLIAAALIIYGAAGLLVNAGLLLWPGLDLQDPTARLGQALLWYPMLLVWGLVLAAGLRRVRATPAA
ncbi:hypothetical protein [Nesterenkonia sp. CF4.4]|uniref:hypothetical protein n=1 Tax=Nesterenkonia sp. CF4.4 TaxID=3373079 RepID=UPI003EE59FEA